MICEELLIEGKKRDDMDYWHLFFNPWVSLNLFCPFELPPSVSWAPFWVWELHLGCPSVVWDLPSPRPLNWVHICGRLDTEAFLCECSSKCQRTLFWEGFSGKWEADTRSCLSWRLFAVGRSQPQMIVDWDREECRLWFLQIFNIVQLVNSRSRILILWWSIIWSIDW